VLGAASRGDIKELNTIFKQDPECLTKKFEWGWTAAHYAGACGQDEMLSFLAGIDADLLVARNDYGLTPMHYAAANGQIHAVKLMAKRMPKLLEMQANDGRTSLDMARTGGCRDFLMEQEQKKQLVRAQQQARAQAQRAREHRKQKGCMVALLDWCGLMSPEEAEHALPHSPGSAPATPKEPAKPTNPDRERGASFDFARVVKNANSASRHFDSQVV